jgi:hypothetical protein
MGWVEDEARKAAIIFRDGPELWRDLNVSLRQAVEDYTRIYSPMDTQEVKFTNFQPDTCVRVSTVPNAEDEDSPIEVRLSLFDQTIICDDSPWFTLSAKSGTVTLETLHRPRALSVEDACRMILRPLFWKLPHRKPNITI